MGFSIEGNWDIWCGILPLAAHFAQKGPVALGISGAVRGFQQGPPLVLRFHKDVPLNVPVQQLDGMVDRVISAVLVSLEDEGSHNVGGKAAVVPNITTRDVVSSGVAEDVPEDFFTAGQEVCRGATANFLSALSLLKMPPSQPWRSSWKNALSAARAGRDWRGRWLWGNGQLAQKGDTRWGGLALGGESSKEMLVRNSKLRTVDRPVAPRASSLAAALSSPVMEKLEGWWALKSPSTIWCPQSSRRASKTVA